MTWPARAAAGALTVALAFTWTAPLAAAEVSTSAASQKISLAAATSAKLAKLEAKDAARATQSAAPATSSSAGSQSFIKSPKGIAVMLLMAVGTGYAIYSAKEQRIDNPVR
jgi:hypothetical protein